jgi:hypothetical protein
VLDFVGYACVKMYPAARAVSGYVVIAVRAALGTAYDICCLVVQNVCGGIWAVALLVARAGKWLLKRFFKGLKRALVRVWRNPVLCLALCAAAVYGVVWVKTNHPEFSFRGEAQRIAGVVRGAVDATKDWAVWARIGALVSAAGDAGGEGAAKLVGLARLAGVAIAPAYKKAAALNAWRWFGSRTYVRAQGRGAGGRGGGGRGGHDLAGRRGGSGVLPPTTPSLARFTRRRLPTTPATHCSRPYPARRP